MCNLNKNMFEPVSQLIMHSSVFYILTKSRTIKCNVYIYIIIGSFN